MPPVFFTLLHAVLMILLFGPRALPDLAFTGGSGRVVVPPGICAEWGIDPM